MASTWIALKDIPAEGRDFSFSDAAAQQAWDDLFREFKLEARVVEPFAADFTVWTQDEGVLIRGRLAGRVELDCSRCTTPVEHAVDLEFELFEQPPEDAAQDEDRCQFLRRENGVLELNPAEMLWEEFSLDLPVKLVCGDACLGLCPDCGVNLNENRCNCRTEEGDPRLAALRGLKIKQ